MTKRGKVNGSLFGAACIVGQAIALNLLSVPAAAYIVRSLGPENYGRWAAASSLVASALMVTSLGLRGIFVRTVARDPGVAARATADQLGVRILLSLAAGTLALAACVSMRYPAVVLRCTAIGVVGIVCSAVVSTLIDLLQGLENLPSLAFVQLTAGITLTVVSVLAVWLGAGPEGLTVAYLLGPLTTMTLLIRHVRRRCFPFYVSWDLRKFGRLMFESRYVGAQQCVTALGANSEMLIVPKLLGMAEFGFFSAGTLLASRLEIVPDGLGTAAYPAISKNHERVEDASREAIRFVGFGLIGCIPLAVLGTALAGAVAQILFPRDPAVCTWIIRITIWSIPLMAVDRLLGQSLNAVGRENRQAGIVVKAGLCHAAATGVLIYYLGVTGACLSWLLRYPIHTAFRLPLFLEIFRPRLGDLRIARILICNAGLAFLVWCVHGLGFFSGHGLGPGLAPYPWVGKVATLAFEGGVGVAGYFAFLVVVGLMKVADVSDFIGRGVGRQAV